jgi:hypothetical protein
MFCNRFDRKRQKTVKRMKYVITGRGVPKSEILGGGGKNF